LPFKDSRWSSAWSCALIFLATFIVYHPALHGDLLWDDAGHVTRPDLQSFAGLGRIWFEIGATQQYYPVLHSAFWLEHRLWGDSALGYHLLNVLLHATAACLFAFVLRRLLDGYRCRAGSPDPAMPGSKAGSGDPALQLPAAAGSSLATDHRPQAGFLRPLAGAEWLAAGLFALHPVCVESVAWISEQKNTLSAVFYLAAALAYLRFDSCGRGALTPRGGGIGALAPRGEGTPPTNGGDAPPSARWFDRGEGAAAPSARAKRAYALATVLFFLALLTKTVTATLPAALLVIFWWRRGRIEWRRDVMPLLPWFVLGAGSGLFTAHFERELIGAQGADFSLNVIERGLLAGRVFWFYLAQLVWPANLIFIYPRWTIDAAQWWQWLFLAAALGLLAALVLAGRRHSVAEAGRLGRLSHSLGAHPAPNETLTRSATFRVRARAALAALLLFGGTLFPVLGFFNVYPFIYSYVADHFQYLAGLPIFALAAAGLMTALYGSRGRSPHPIAAAVTPPVSPNGGNREGRAGLRPASSRALEGRSETGPTATPASIRYVSPAVVLTLLATLAILTWRQAGMYRDAVTLYETTLARNPAAWMAHNNLAIEFVKAGREAAAIAHYEAVLKLRPDYPQAENNLGDALVRLDRAAEAIPHFERAIQLESRYAVAHRSLGMALAMTGRTEEAVAHFAQAVQIQPTYAEAELYWAAALAQTGRFAEARPHFERAIALAPDSADFRNTYGEALAHAGQLDAAVAQYEASLRLDGPQAEVHANLARALRRLGRYGEARDHERAAQQLTK